MDSKNGALHYILRALQSTLPVMGGEASAGRGQRVSRVPSNSLRIRTATTSASYIMNQLFCKFL